MLRALHLADKIATSSARGRVDSVAFAARLLVQGGDEQEKWEGIRKSDQVDIFAHARKDCCRSAISAVYNSMYEARSRREYRLRNSEQYFACDINKAEEESGLDRLHPVTHEKGQGNI